MKELKFNQGGQPIYLDDLKTLQDLTEGIAEVFKYMYMLSLTVAEADVFFLPQPMFRIEGTFPVLKAGWLYVHGRLVKYTVGTPMAISSFQNAYLNIYHTTGDQRVLANGSTAQCSDSWAAVISDTNDPSATETYQAANVPTLAGSLQTFIRNTIENS